MRSRSFSLLSFGVLVMLTSCATPVDFSGPHSAGLSDGDVEQIKLLVSQRSDIRKPIFRIWVDRPDSVLVQSGRQSYVGDMFDEFRVSKKRGRWEIASKITEARILVTAD
jgi:hypothetical protein